MNMKDKDTKCDWNYNVFCRPKGERGFQIEWGVFKDCTRKEAQDSVDAIATRYSKEYMPVAGVVKPQFYGTTKQVGKKR